MFERKKEKQKSACARSLFLYFTFKVLNFKTEAISIRMFLLKQQFSIKLESMIHFVGGRRYLGVMDSGDEHVQCAPHRHYTCNISQVFKGNS